MPGAGVPMVAGGLEGGLCSFIMGSILQLVSTTYPLPLPLSPDPVTGSTPLLLDTSLPPSDEERSVVIREAGTLARLVGDTLGSGLP